MKKLKFQKFQVARLTDSQKSHIIGGTDADTRKSINNGPLCDISQAGCDGHTDGTAGGGNG